MCAERSVIKFFDHENGTFAEEESEDMGRINFWDPQRLYAEQCFQKRY